ncbi:NADP-dependent phosphogluconate dehydrogenase [Hymenobacter sp. BT683]|uniref:6-phosphogluconate dehydrogenase, decarboxylating n=1 Tax=Hymenobacter jeongseonensis TaxID=2791027 RepID=A0ABS0IFG2_9BACT|nr:NADP-dependent phosphogluconate dehydrogenase [Hymenobacter jeongseonensis]MBF9236663.1 NADP-dependent phosphogluconate dehydrogenase [Hymenobacter jeongseonensis]
MTTPPVSFSLGMIGLGTMGRNLLLNLADHEFAVAGYDKDAEKIRLLAEEGVGKPVLGFTDIAAFVQSLHTPRSIMLLVPAGKIVDNVIEELLPLLTPGDIIIDGGNSYFTDTNRRDAALAAAGFHFFGMGISGGEEGARFGPSMMPGGDKQAYAVVQPLFEAIAARADDGAPCVTYIGPGAAGHFVKMVHNGIEYGLMQLIAETYELMKRGLGLDNAAIGRVFAQWNSGRLQSFLLDITKDIFTFRAPNTDHLLLDDIKDEARSKGTGKWTSQVAMDLEVPLPTVDTAVTMRNLSKAKALREQLATLYGPAPAPLVVDAEAFLASLEEAFFFNTVITYAQGMQLLAQASVEFSYDLQLAEIAKIWRGGCIIRSAFLNDIFNAYQQAPGLAHLLLDARVREQVSQAVPGARTVVAAAVSAGLAAPAYAASLSYFDALRSARMPSNLIQAQRDYFGAHTYELIGHEGVFHSQWTPLHEDAANKSTTQAGPAAASEQPVIPNK